MFLACCSAAVSQAAPFPAKISGLSELRTPKDRHGAETGANMIPGFVVNAQTWHGETARRIKTELKEILKAHPAS